MKIFYRVGTSLMGWGLRWLRVGAWASLGACSDADESHFL